MVKHSLSWWGIKNSGDDITTEIMRIINSADLFIIVCGYNFTFSTSSTARTFFDALSAKILSGVKVLMIFPPKLHGKYNPQPRIIEYCLTHNLPIILNHQNHSKWLLSDKDLYYGSSNFTNASWKDRVEVLSIHEHTKLARGWSQRTINDFKDFVNDEISNLNTPARHMKDYRGLLISTTNAWKSIKSLVYKFNPSINKVIATLENYDEMNSLLGEQVVFWFEHYSKREFEIIFNLSSEISNSVANLCEFAYGNIYNETAGHDNLAIDELLIEEYNKLYLAVLNTIDRCINDLPKENDNYKFKSELANINLAKINSIKGILNNYSD